MAVERIGTYELYQDTGQTGSETIAVPVDCTLVVIMGVLYLPETNWIDSNPFTVNSVQVEDAIVYDDAVESGHIYVGYLANPDTGNQTMAWDWGDTPADGAHICVVFYKGVDTGDPITDSGKNNETSGDTVTITVAGLTYATGDMIVGAAWSYDVDNSTNTNGQTTIVDTTRVNDCYAGFAEKLSESDWSCTNCNYPGACAIVLNAAAVPPAGNIIPHLIHRQFMARN